ncbi:jg18596 [Pararge aegeria aegeria]|uniref:Jg18596 protein n=1 Tax=Pararge aegeria aegeria TaxID=348720 RepID=A0A8S4R5J7_9NEOP|nr:jg18596 [Pararge aegeria aegeria]
MFAKTLILTAVLSVAAAGIIAQPHYSSAAAVSSQSIVRHDQPHGIVAAAPVAYHAAPVAYQAAPVAYQAAPVAYRSAPVAYAAPAHYAAPTLNKCYYGYFRHIMQGLQALESTKIEPVLNPYYVKIPRVHLNNAHSRQIAHGQKKALENGNLKRIHLNKHKHKFVPDIDVLLYQKSFLFPDKSFITNRSKPTTL